MIVNNLDFEKAKYKDFVLIKCDYCKEEIKKTKAKVRKGRKVIEKDCCSQEICTKKKLKEINLLKYGVVNSFQRKDVKDKIKETNLKKYGCEYAQQNEKIREKSRATCLKNFGVEHALQNKDILNKAQEKSQKKYGTKFPIQLEEFKQKVKKTNLEKYGIENFLSSKEIQEKIKQTNIEKYGTPCPASSDQIKEKIKKTNLEKYGSKNCFGNQEIQEKIKQTNLEKYGTSYPASSDQIQEKIKKTNLEKYGYENCLSSKEIQEKIRQTNIEKYGTPFPICKFGKTQNSIKDWLNGYGFNFNSDFKILEGKELDLYDENKNFAIEYCGIYWHNENSPQPRHKKYHYEKYKKCKDKNIQLLTIFDDEWNDNQEIIKSVILSKLGIFEKRIYARKCETKEITKKEMNNFCDQYHIQGKNSLSLVCFGLFFQDELVGVVDLGRHHRKKNEESLVLTRLCFKKGYQIVGGSSKLFKCCVNYCKNNNIKNIISWSDNRWSDGKVYKNLGFVFEEDLGPDYSYVDSKSPKKRISKQSQKKSNSKCPENMSELEWANFRGLSRIWDCGKTRWNFLIN